MENTFLTDPGDPKVDFFVEYVKKIIISRKSISYFLHVFRIRKT